jgi:hypothetical protein
VLIDNNNSVGPVLQNTTCTAQIGPEHVHIKCASQLGLLLHCNITPPSSGISQLCSAHLSGSSKHSIAPHLLFPSPHLHQHACPSYLNTLLLSPTSQRPTGLHGALYKPRACASSLSGASSLRSTLRQRLSCCRPAPTRTGPPLAIMAMLCHTFQSNPCTCLGQLRVQIDISNGLANKNSGLSQPIPCVIEATICNG